MKKQLTLLSIAANLVLLATVVWMHTEHDQELLDLSKAAMRGDERHIGVHASSLAAIEGGDEEATAETAEMLRSIIATGTKNMEQRRRLGLFD